MKVSKAVLLFVVYSLMAAYQVCIVGSIAVLWLYVGVLVGYLEFVI